jgi:phospholipid transport system substrate-binding protein
MLNNRLAPAIGCSFKLSWPRLLVATALALPLLMPASAPAIDTAVQVVENLHAELTAVMKQAVELGYAGRYKRLAPIVTAAYDLPYISKVVVGRYWKNFSKEQKSQFVETFTRFSIATYADRFDGYSGEKFQTISWEEIKKRRYLIKTVLIKANGENIELDYILHESNNQWRIINVIAEGVSDLSLKRADYTSYLNKKGFDDLLKKLNEKIKQCEK